MPSNNIRLIKSRRWTLDLCPSPQHKKLTLYKHASFNGRRCGGKGGKTNLRMTWKEWKSHTPMVLWIISLACQELTTIATANSPSKKISRVKKPGAAELLLFLLCFFFQSWCALGVYNSVNPTLEDVNLRVCPSAAPASSLLIWASITIYHIQGVLLISPLYFHPHKLHWIRW
jgi:hypothetical protein